MEKYYLLSTASVEPVILDKEYVSRVTRGLSIKNYHLRKDAQIKDVVVNDKPKKIVLNFSHPLMLGVIDELFLTSFIDFSIAEKYIDFSRISVKKKTEIEPTQYLLFKCKNILYLRGNKDSFYRERNELEPTVYLDKGSHYVTNIPDKSIPIFGTQYCEELIVSEELIAPIIAKGRLSRVYVNKLKIQEPVDGLVFKDYILENDK